jgi:hypothetical protein
VVSEAAIGDDVRSFDVAAWDPEAYAACYYPAANVGRENDGLIQHQTAIWRVIARGAHRHPANGGTPPRDLVLLGGGGMLWDVAAAAPHVRGIRYCDPLDANRRLVSRFVAARGESAWDRYIDATLRHERGGIVSPSMVHDRRALMRDVIKRIDHCDVTRHPPVTPLAHEQPSFAMHFVAESVTSSKAAWRLMMANVAAAVPAGGCLLLSSLVNAAGWRSSTCGRLQPAVRLGANEIEVLLESLGFALFYTGSIAAESRDSSDYESLLVTASVKTADRKRTIRPG